MPQYFTYKDNVPLLPGQTLGFTKGKGYYAAGTPTPNALRDIPSDAGNRSPAQVAQSVATQTQTSPTPDYATPSPDEPPPAVADIPSDAGVRTPDGPAAQSANAAAAEKAALAAAIDWSAVLGEYGLPADIVAELNRIFRVTDYDPTTAVPIAQAYLRGTSWYAQTYPRIQDGINAGLFQDERGYRSYQNQVDQIYQQYYGRIATPSEAASYMATGKSINQVAQQFQAEAFKGTISDPLRVLFTDAELSAYANQAAGIDTQLGQRIAAEADLAMKVAPLYQDFYGRTVTRGELDQLTANGTDAKAVAQNFAVENNIKAMDPAVRDLFTEAEIRQIALDQAGGVSQNGGALRALANLSLQLNPVYHQYTGAGVSRAEVEQAYGQGLTPDVVGKQFAGKAFIDANRGDIQQTSGAFGETGALTDPQLKAFGEETAGLDTPMGQLLATQYQKALQRMHGVFKGVLASPALSLSTGKLAGPTAGIKPDIPA